MKDVIRILQLAERAISRSLGIPKELMPTETEKVSSADLAERQIEMWHLRLFGRPRKTQAEIEQEEYDKIRKTYHAIRLTSILIWRINDVQENVSEDI